MSLEGSGWEGRAGAQATRRLSGRSEGWSHQHHTHHLHSYNAGAAEGKCRAEAGLGLAELSAPARRVTLGKLLHCPGPLCPICGVQGSTVMCAVTASCPPTVCFYPHLQGPPSSTKEWSLPAQ